MAIAPLFESSPGTPGGVLAQARESIVELTERLWVAQTDADLVGVVDELARLRSSVTALEAHVVAEADARDLAKKTLRYGSTGDWLTHAGRLAKGEGQRVVRHAKALTSDRKATLAGLTAGTVSPRQADSIIKRVAALPSDPALRERAEAVLLDQATKLDATDLDAAGRRILAVVDPEGEDARDEVALDREERHAHLTRRLTICTDAVGGVRISGYGSVEDGAVIKAALLGMARPGPTDSETDPDTDGQQPARTDSAARAWDALVRVSRHATDTGLVPEAHGQRPTVVITMTWQDLSRELSEKITGSSIVCTATGDRIPVSAARRMACDAEIVPAVLGSHGEVLDIGRRTRVVPTGIWHALVLRDRHCAFPSCDRPPVMAHAHHVRHWANGGPTSLDNLVLLCGHRHRTIHDTPWEVRINPTDHLPEFLPPPKPEIPREWTRTRSRLE